MHARVCGAALATAARPPCFFPHPAPSSPQGHRSFECPTKPGGGGGSRMGGGGGNCFSCGQPGHRSAECPSKGAGGGRSGERERSRERR